MSTLSWRIADREFRRIFAKYPRDQAMSFIDRIRMDWALWLLGHPHPWYISAHLRVRRAFGLFPYDR